MEYDLRKNRAAAAAVFLGGVLFLAVGLFGVIRGVWGFFALLAASAALFFLCWVCSPRFQFGKMPLSKKDGEREGVRTVYALWRKKLSADPGTGPHGFLPRRLLLPLLTLLASASIFAAVFLGGNFLFPSPGSGIPAPSETVQDSGVPFLPAD